VKRLLAISAMMKTSRPVFIVGEARSGTSILYRTLQKHASFRPYRPDLTETEIFSHLRRTFLFSDSYPESLSRFMLNDRLRYGQFLESIRPLRLLSALAIGVNLLARDRSDLVWYANLNHLLLRSYFFHATMARGCGRLVEKTPTNTSNLPRLERSFPEARFLYVYRHPVDVFSSYRRRAHDDPQAAWAAELTPELFSTSYAASVERVLRWIDRRPSLRMVRYETFTSHPEQELRSICDFLGEAFDPEMTMEREPHPGRWRGDPLLWGEIVPVTKDWHDHMDVVEADAIQANLAGVMERLDYPPYSS
jgi:Sulfotransferase family